MCIVASGVMGLSFLGEMAGEDVCSIGIREMFSVKFTGSVMRIQFLFPEFTRFDLCLPSKTFRLSALVNENKIYRIRLVLHFFHHLFPHPFSGGGEGMTCKVFHKSHYCPNGECRDTLFKRLSAGHAKHSPKKLKSRLPLSALWEQGAGSSIPSSSKECARCVV